MPKEVLPMVSKPLIQYVDGGVCFGGVDTLIFVADQNNRTFEDQFDTSNEKKIVLRANGKDMQADKDYQTSPIRQSRFLR